MLDFFLMNHSNSNEWDQGLKEIILKHPSNSCFKMTPSPNSCQFGFRCHLNEIIILQKENGAKCAPTIKKNCTVNQQYVVEARILSKKTMKLRHGLLLALFSLHKTDQADDVICKPRFLYQQNLNRAMSNGVVICQKNLRTSFGGHSAH